MGKLQAKKWAVFKRKKHLGKLLALGGEYYWPVTSQSSTKLIS
jgi:hypothetical protein